MIRANGHGVITIPFFHVGAPGFSDELLLKLVFHPQDVLS